MQKNVSTLVMAVISSMVYVSMVVSQAGRDTSAMNEMVITFSYKRVKYVKF